MGFSMQMHFIFLYKNNENVLFLVSTKSKIKSFKFSSIHVRLVNPDKELICRTGATSMNLES